MHQKLRLRISSQRTRELADLSLPLVLIFIFQNLMLVAGLIMGGHLGSVALAAIGVGNAFISIFTALLFGLDTGVQVLVAQRRGAGDTNGALSALKDGLTIAMPSGLLLMVFVGLLSPALLDWSLGPADGDVASYAAGYVRASSPSFLFLAFNFVFSAYWNGNGKAHLSFLAMLFQLPVSVTFSYLLMFGVHGFPRLETAGAGAGMTLGAIAATAAHLVFSVRQGLLPSLSRLKNTAAGLSLIPRIGMPVSIQQALLYVGIMVLVSIIALLGTRNLAAANIVSALLLFSILPVTGIGIAAAVLTGHAVGRGDYRDVKRRAWESAWTGALVILPVSLVFLIFPRDVTGLFVENSAVSAAAIMPLRLVAAVMPVDALGRILCFALRGTGATRIATLIPFGFQWGLFLPLAWLVGVIADQGLTGIFMTRMILTILETALICSVWQRGLWRKTVPGLIEKRTTNNAL